MAFMFETRFPQRVTAYAAGLDELQQDYGGYGQRLTKHFNPNRREGERRHATSSTRRTTRSGGAGWPPPTATRTSRSRTCRSASSRRRAAARPARRRGDRRHGARPRRRACRAGLFTGEAARAAEAASGGTAERACSPWAPAPRRALRARLSEICSAGRERRAEGMRERLLARGRRLRAAPAGAHRRLHRLLRRHPPRDQRRQAVPPRQPAAAELQVRADRLPRPRLIGCAVGHAGPAPQRAAQAAGRRRRRASARAAARLRAGARRLDRPRQRARRADPDRRSGPSTSPATACSTTGRRATSRPGSTSRSGRSWPRTSAPRCRPGSSRPRRWRRSACPQPPRPEGDPAPLPYLLDEADQREGALDLELEVLLLTPGLREKGMPPHRLVAAATRGTCTGRSAQMVAHHACNGCNLQPGDLLGSGTHLGARRAGLRQPAGDDPGRDEAGRARNRARNAASWRTATR